MVCQNIEDMEAMVNAGASRIGTSSGISLMNHNKVQKRKETGVNYIKKLEFSVIINV